MKKLLPFLIGAGILFAGVAYALVSQPFQGGTGTGATPASGTVLIGNGTGTYTAGNLLCSGGCSITNASGSITINQGASSATTTINGVTGPTFTFSIVSTTSASSITTSSAQLFLNLLKYTSGTNISVAANGVINFVNPGFLTNASITATGPITWSGASVIACPTCLTSAPATTTINGTQTSTFYIVGTSGVTTTVSGATTTFSLAINNGVTQTCPAGQAVVSTTAQGIVGCSTFATSTGGSAAGASGDIQINNGGNFGVDTGILTYSTSSHQLALTSASGSAVFGNFLNVLSLAYTGATSSFTVPAGVTSLTVNLLGAAGGTNTVGGFGGSVTSTIAVTPGQVYYYGVGQKGAANAGGFGGGGTGQASNGGGGGMTWFSSASKFVTSSVTLVAGGGGGINAGPAGAGAGGGLIGQSASSSASCTAATGGTQSAGGTGGSGSAAGTSASEGQGGNGGFNGGSGGGGGGGGYFGGGGGGATSAVCATGGAGGSSFIIATSTITLTSTAQGINNGDGAITITYRAPSPTGNFVLGAAGHVITGNQSSSPSMVNGLISGNDTAGLIQVSSSTTTYTLTFGQTWVNAPVCTANVASGTSAYFIVHPGTTSTLFTANTALATTTQFNYMCLGY